MPRAHTSTAVPSPYSSRLVSPYDAFVFARLLPSGELSLFLSPFVVRQLIAISRWMSLIPRFEIINPLQWNGKENFQSLCIESDIETKVDSPSWRIIFKLSGFSANDNTNWSCTRGGGGLVTNNCRSSNSEAIGSTSTSVETIGRDSSRLSPKFVHLGFRVVSNNLLCDEAN